MSAPGILAAFGAGLLSFLSPCVLPLIPGWLSFMGGGGVAELRAGTGRLRIFSRSLAFSLGFALVFSLLGVVLAGGSLALGAGIAGGGPGLPRILNLAAGLVVILLGAGMLLDRPGLFGAGAKISFGERAGRGLFGSFLLGLAFAAGWSPCVGPILASILFLAAREGNLLRSLGLLGAYSAGLALPFLAAGLFFERLSPLMAFFKRRGREVRIVSGLLLLVLGLTMAFGRLSALSAAFPRAGFAIKRILAEDPGLARAIGVGLWILLAALAPILALIRRRPLLRARVILPAAAFILLAGLEAAGILSSLGLLALWFLFQG